MVDTHGRSRRRQLLIAVAAFLAAGSQFVRITVGDGGDWAILASALFLLLGASAVWQLFRT